MSRAREIGRAPTEAGAKLQELEHEQDNQCGPDLDLRSILSGDNEGLDAWILFPSLN